jgi:flagellar basal-body rod protein FlgC
MDYFNAFAISAAGMRVEKMRTDVVALNLANMHSSRRADGSLFRPLQVTVVPGPAFAAGFERLAGLPVVRLDERDVEPRLAYEPGSPDADANGMVSRPAVNQVEEMATMSSAMRAYQANVVALNAAKAMALKALELGAQ